MLSSLFLWHHNKLGLNVWQRYEICNKPAFFCFSMHGFTLRHSNWKQFIFSFINICKTTNEACRWKYLHICYCFRPACVWFGPLLTNLNRTDESGNENVQLNFPFEQQTYRQIIILCQKCFRKVTDLIIKHWFWYPLRWKFSKWGIIVIRGRFYLSSAIAWMWDVDQDHCELTIGLVCVSVYSHCITLGCIYSLKVPTVKKVMIMANRL